jgi:ABC-type transporter Mla subunit MlaD
MIRPVESPSLIETAMRMPGTLLRLPGTALRALDALNNLADRLEKLMALLERMEGGVSRAGIGVELAATGISQAVSGLEKAVGTLDGSLPTLSDSASALRSLTERLSGVAIELATELPKATATLQDISPELAKVVGTFDERFSHLDVVVTDLARLVEAVIGTIPGMRRVLRTTTGV